MADEAEKTEVKHLISHEKRTSPFFFASRYDTKEKSKIDFCRFF